MDWLELRNKGLTTLKKYKYMILAILAGILLLSFPEQQSNTEEKDANVMDISCQQTLEDNLSQILGMMEGAGRVEVLLTQEKGEEFLYQTDDALTSGEYSQDHRKSTVLISGDNRAETGLLRQRNPPVYLGAIVLCQGADKASIRLAIVEAVTDATGLGSDRITVLKMK